MEPPGYFSFLRDALARPKEVEQLWMQTDDASFRIPDRVAEMTRLHTLSIDGMVTRFTNLGVLSKLPVLHSLHLQYRLIDVPPEIAELTALEELHLRGHYRSLPRLSRLRALRQLELLSPNLGALPDWIGELHALTTLKVPHAGLSEIPASVGELAQLEMLDLQGNRIRVVPDSLSRCAQLKRVYLSNNALERLPAWMARLESLAVARNPTLRDIPRILAPLIGSSVPPAQFEKAARNMLVSAASRALEIFEQAAREKERTAWLPIVSRRGKGRSHLGGTPWLARGEKWPACALCGQRMPLWLQIDDAPFEPGGLLQWFRCMGCPGLERMIEMRALMVPAYRKMLDGFVRGMGLVAAQKIVAAYRSERPFPEALREAMRERGVREGDAFFLSKGQCHFLARKSQSFELARIIDARGRGRAVRERAPGGFGPLHIRQWKAVVDRPMPSAMGIDSYWEVMKRLQEKQRAQLYEWNLQRDKLGGWPRWLQGEGAPSCRRCRREMRPLFLVDSDGRSAIPWGGSGLIHLLQCPKHLQELRTVHEND